LSGKGLLEMLKSIAFYSLIVFLAVSCIRNVTEPIPSDTEIVEIWDNGQPRVVRLFLVVDSVKTAVKEIQYHSNGIKSMEGPLENEVRHGMWKSYFEDGTLWSEGAFQKGLRHGKGIVYHPNGRKFIEGTYMLGERVGKWTWWDENGSVISESEAMKITIP
jgi:hypothetical protein